MKQHISVEQLNELSETQLNKYDDWLLSHGYVNNEINIGQMIEFIYEHKVFVLDILDNTDRCEEWCDRLWSTVKHVLNK